jgi:hypothetical protein
MKKLANEIYHAVNSGELEQPFTAAMVKRACPRWAEKTYQVFLPKHRKGNPGGNTVLFDQVARGSYQLISD